MISVCSQPIIKMVAANVLQPTKSHNQLTSIEAALKIMQKSSWILMIKCCGSCKLCVPACRKSLTVGKFEEIWTFIWLFQPFTRPHRKKLKMRKKKVCQQKNSDFAYEFKWTSLFIFQWEIQLVTNEKKALENGNKSIARNCYGIWRAKAH